MRTLAIVVVLLVLLVIVALVVLAARRNRRRALLRQRFGPEYDAAVSRGKDRRAVEQRLAGLAERRDSLQIRDVDLQEHERFAQRWADVQHGFVDDPGQAVADADGLINAVLRSRGYPVENFDDRAALVATDHQDVVERYRAAHDTYAEHLQTGSADIARLRDAFLSYREVFDRVNQPERGAESAAENPPALEARQPAPVTNEPPAEPVAERGAEPVRGAGPAAEPPQAAEPPPAAVRLDEEEVDNSASRQQGH